MAIQTVLAASIRLLTLIVRRFVFGRNVRVVIFGSHAPEWTVALGPAAVVWDKLPHVVKVLHLENTAAEIPPEKNCRTVVIPLMELHIAKLPSGARALAPSPEALRVLSDKAAFAAYARQKGLSALCPVHFDSLENASFPCVIKRTDLNAGVGVQVVWSIEQARALLLQETFLEKPVVLQSFIQRERDYVAHCVCKAGRILWMTAYEVALEPGMTTDIGKAHRRRIPVPPEHSATIEKFLAPIAFTGPCAIDYTIGPGGGMVIFEINPRMGGTLMWRAHILQLREALACIIRHA